MAKAETFYDEKPVVEVDVVKAFGTGGMFLVEYGTKKLVRHRDRLQPLDEEARRLLRK